MRVAFISDIHANCFALDAAFASLENDSVDKVVCLGDTVQGGAQPKETVRRLRQLACPVVLGNADAWLFNESNAVVEPTSQQQRDVRGWTLAQLSAGDLDYMRGFQRTVEVRIDDVACVLCFHGSPYSYDDVLLPETSNEDWNRLLGGFPHEIMAGGHTHTQQLRRIGEGLFFNPGSVGVVYNYHTAREHFHTDPWAEYAVLSVVQGRPTLSFQRVPYDVEEYIGILEASDRPHVQTMIADYRREH